MVSNKEQISKEIYIFFGTTAELIKIIPIIRELKRRKIKYRIVLSGQTDVNFDEFEKLIGRQDIYYSFRSKISKSSPLYFTVWALRTLIAASYWFKRESAFKNKENMTFLVQGDTVTTLIGGIAAKVAGVKLAHIESGLRSHNFLEPFPEEASRHIISYLADINFCPNELACRNIKERKGIKVNTNWNTIVETLKLAHQVKINSFTLKSLKNMKYFIIFLHRQEHVFLRKNDTIKLVNLLLRKIKEKKMTCLFIIPNVTRTFFNKAGLLDRIENDKYIKVVPRLPFLEFIRVLQSSEFIISDGGANQPESHFLGKPNLLLRKLTEQTEGIGENVVLSKEDSRIITDFFKNYKKYKGKQKKITKWPSKIIVDTLIKY